MRWLLWKDYRQNRLIVWTALVLLLAPHLVGLYAACRAKFRQTWFLPRWNTQYFVESAKISLVISQLAVALIAGNAIGGERVDRSAEFLFSLPIRRRKLLIGKLLLALIIVAVPWMFNVPIVSYLAEPEWTLRVFYPAGTVSMFCRDTAIWGMTFFCVAWFLSSFRVGPALAAFGGLVTPVFIIWGIQCLNLLNSEWYLRGRTADLWFNGICMTIAPPCFILGTWHYLWRDEP